MSAIFIIIGVSGCGKSTVGALLAKELALPFYDADDFHPATNIAKMRAGNPLNDKDREPWLLSLNGLLTTNKETGAVLACSALKDSYRKILQGNLNVNWIHLNGDFELIQHRMQERAHFMPDSLLESQFAALEPLNEGLTLNIEQTPEELVGEIISHFPTAAKAAWGIIGMGVMGRSLALNAISKGIATAVYNRDTADEAHIIPQMMAENLSPLLSGFSNWGAFFNQLELPRKILLMLPAGDAIDKVLDQITPHLNAGDCVIDGGNSNYKDSDLRLKEFEAKGIGFLGMGVSGGQKGALNGPALMSGGTKAAFDRVAPLLAQIAAKDPGGNPCMGYLGNGGAGHLVKTIHNGIEYAEMQLIAELYALLAASDVPRSEFGNVFTNWNRGEFSSYLLGIMPAILDKKDGDDFLLDKILDVAGSKGTGTWTALTALEFGQDMSISVAAVNARFHSAADWYRSPGIAGQFEQKNYSLKLELDEINNGYQAARILNHLQGLRLINAVSDQLLWNIDLAEVCRIWTNGCILKSDLIVKLYEQLVNGEDNLESWCVGQYKNLFSAFKNVIALSVEAELHLPAFNAAWQFGLGISSEKTTACIIQAQRDYFGAHTYKRKDADLSENFHTDWDKS